MARYSTEAEAEADGFAFTHDTERGEFTATLGERVIGVLHYSLFEGDRPAIDFDHTEVIPEFRGSGIAGLLAARALRSGVIGDRSIRTSCWYMEGVVARHPELRER